MSKTSDRVDRASRLVRATPEEVFGALVDREAVLRWLPLAGATATLEAFEPRPGGPFRMTLRFGGSDGSTKRKTSDDSDTVDGAFVEIIPPRLVSQQFDFVSEDPRFAGAMTMTWTLAEAPVGTLVTVAAENVPVGISPEDHQVGMASSLANLASYVERSATTAPTRCRLGSGQPKAR
jgi:uncharacterized protein YndB with AHSA1/START domain